jgi:hypothetical protein
MGSQLTLSAVELYDLADTCTGDTWGISSALNIVTTSDSGPGPTSLMAYKINNQSSPRPTDIHQT